MLVNEETLSLLRRLKAADRPLSGALLAREYGVSRVALWKRFEALRAAGYAVQADRSGYRLLPGDKPLPWEFPGDEDRTFHFDQVASTMDEAQRLGFGGLREGVVVAEHQTAGRGRANRLWDSPGGNLLATLLLRPGLPLVYAGALALEALTALAEILSALYQLELTCKWPNDLMAGTRKVAGILVEAWGGTDQPRFYTLGLGLNVHGLPALDRPVASLDALGRPQADRRLILARWRAHMNRWAETPRPDPARWAARAVFSSRTIIETFDGQMFDGIPLGFDRTGSLLLGRHDQTIPIRFGEARRVQGAAL